jgi:beta-lactamase regulating signal transducer with metallopeptidase domain
VDGNFAAETAARSSAAPEIAAAPAAALPAPPARRSAGAVLRAALLPAIALGAVIVLGLALVRAARFRRLLRDARPAPDSLARRADAIAAAMGMRRAPRIRLVDAHLPPVLWPGPPCEILLPARLAGTLSGGELDAMLAHELGHVRRRDHWTRGLELAAVALFWWHPVTWWARRNLRAAEESCCDALVVRTLGDGTRAYADALLKTLEFLARSPHRPVPALATGAGDFQRLKERLTMIVNRSTTRPLSPWRHRIVLGLALAALTVGPSWTAAETRGDDVPTTVATPTAPPAPVAPAPPRLMTIGEDPKLIAALEKLQTESSALDRQMLDLERQRALLQLRMEELEADRQALDLKEEAELLQKEGRTEQAELIRQQAKLLREHVELRRLEVQRDHERNVNRLEIDAKLQALEMRRTAAELSTHIHALEAPDAD